MTGNMSIVQFKELRTLIVPVEAAVDAVLELDRCHGGRLARAKVMEAQIEAGAIPGLLLIVRHATAGEPQIEEKRYALPAVAAAVIHYCSRMEVPLPRRAAKSIEVVPEGFELKLSSVTELATLHGEVQCIPGMNRHARSLKRDPDSPVLAIENELSEASAAVG
jgi:hypothetical protein